MNYLSFDVGIKNLAYCELTPERRIKQWGILNLNDDPICQMKKRKQCDKQSTYIVNNEKYYCSTHSKEFKKKKKLNTNHDLCKLSQKCIEKLDTIDLTDIQYVLIENQPALKNPTMKSIQMILYTNYIIKGIMNQESNIEGIYMINARHKLKVYHGPKIECKLKNKYSQNKFLSVEYTRCMICDECDTMKHIFNESKKKDDLADSYLQGIYYIEKKKIIYI